MGVSFWANASSKKTPSDNLCVGSDILTTWAAFELGMIKKLDKKLIKIRLKIFSRG